MHLVQQILTNEGCREVDVAANDMLPEFNAFIAAMPVGTVVGITGTDGTLAKYKLVNDTFTMSKPDLDAIWDVIRKLEQRIEAIERIPLWQHTSAVGVNTGRSL